MLTRLGAVRFWYVPSLLWLSSGSHMLMALCWVGMIASVLLVANFWPRGMLFVCFVCFLSFVAAAQDFSGYQSDGMLLEAGFISLFFAPPGFWPGLGRDHPPSRASLFLLQWEWFRIYFESGVVKLASGDPEWRNFTAMDEYYQNGPLPTWIGWYVQHLPHGFHAFATGATLVLELGLVCMLFLPRRWRIACFFIVTAVADPGHPDRELHLPELSGAAAGRAAAGRSLPAARHAGAMESIALPTSCRAPQCGACRRNSRTTLPTPSTAQRALGPCAAR